MTGRAEFARSLIENPEFVGLITELRNHQFDVIEKSPPSAVAQREAAYAVLRALGMLFDMVDSYARAGAHERGRQATRRMMGAGDARENA
jgi:hypothetical protein